jgi:hypothetical protein
MRTSALIGGFTVMLVASPAFAALINYKDAAHSGASGQTSYATSAGGTTVTAKAGPVGANITWNAGDGLGVNSTAGWEADEIEGKESLTLTFSQPTLITALYLTDLFREGGYTEKGSYTLDGGAAKEFSASEATGTNGAKTVAVNKTATVIKLYAPDKSGRYEFSLAGVAFADVPELSPEATGTAMTIILGGFAIMFGSRRRRVQIRSTI